MEHHPSGSELRRSTRLIISIRIVIRGKDRKGKTFTEKTQTLVVNQQGALVETSHEFEIGNVMSIENPALGKTANARVVLVDTKPGVAGRSQIAVELTEPQNIWGIDFPPSDWKEEEMRAQPAAPSAAQAVRTPPSPAPIPGRPLPAVEAVKTAVPAREKAVAAAPVELPGRQSAEPPPSTPPLSQPVPDEFRATLQRAVTVFAKQLEEMTKAATRSSQGQLTKLSEETRQALRKELDQLLAQWLESSKAKLRQQAEAELELARRRQEELQRQLVESALKTIRNKVAKVLALLESPPREETDADLSKS